MLIALFAGVAGLGISSRVMAQTTEPSPTPPAPTQAFRRGINLSNWFVNAGRQALVQSDFEKIKTAGFDHVRIPVNPEFLGFSVYDAATGRVLFDFAKTDQAIGFAATAGLSVILDIQPGDNFMSQVEQDRKADSGFVALWGHIAQHYKDRAPDTLAFEILNEPQYKTGKENYAILVSDVVSAIRTAGSKNPIIIESPLGGGIDSLADVTPVRDQNVYYAFHFYEPSLFTHQGMKVQSSIRSLRYFHNLPYPSKFADPNFNYAPVAADPLTAKRDFLDYTAANWDEGHIRARIKVASEWAQANHTRLLCTEFGVIRAYAAPASRYQWIADTRKTLEAADIGWDVSDYSDRFGIVTLAGPTVIEPSDGTAYLVDPASGDRTIDGDAIKALFSD